MPKNDLQTEIENEIKNPFIDLKSVRPFKLVAFGFLFLLCIITAALFTSGAPGVQDIAVAETLNDDYTVTLTVSLKNASLLGGDMYCYLGEQNNPAKIAQDDWQLAEDGTCTFDVNSGNYYVLTKDSLGNYSEAGTQPVEINEIVQFEIPKPVYYLALDGGQDTIKYEMFILGSVDDTVAWSSANTSVAAVSASGTVTANGVGSAVITATASNGSTATTEVVVTDLIIVPTLDSSKPKIPAYLYTEQENDLLDAILFSRVEDAGKATRGGVIAAARFLLLEFPYYIPYFYENGRIENHGSKNFVDGEGRYYHEGLYLHESRYNGIVASLVGPAIWGAPLTNFEDAGYFVPGQKYANGFSCSGFVTWVLKNGGYDFGDVGAGDYAHIDNDLCDLGERVWLTREFLQTDTIQVGDLIGRDGHIAIIVGIDDEYFYIGESLGRGAMITVVERYERVLYHPDYDYVMLMDDEYGEPGIYEDMW